MVGGGVAAGSCVTTLRELGFTGSVAVACDEPHPPYTRPGLTKQVLRGEKPASAALWRPEAWYAEHDVALLTGAPATELDLSERRIDVAGRRVHYRSLVLATGAAPPRSTSAPASTTGFTCCARSPTPTGSVRTSAPDGAGS